MRDIFNEVIASLGRNRLRTALTGFAVAWGIFMIIVLLGAGNGLMNALMLNNDESLVNTMKVWGQFTSKPYDGLKEGRRIRLDDRDIATTESPAFAENVDEVTAVVSQSATMSYGDEYSSVSMVGIFPAYSEMEKVQIQYGRTINEFDMGEKRKVVVVPGNIAELLLKEEGHNERLLGEMVKVGETMFKVVGISKSDMSSNGNECLAPYSTIKTIYNKQNVDNILFSFHGLPDLESNDAFEAKYKKALNTVHRAAPDDRRSIYIWNRYTGNIQMHKAVSAIRIALWIIGLFTLLSGIVGVSNIMLITVKERTHEFGIRKAIGARPSDILKLILSESISITALFGYIGMVAGLLACEIMNMTIGQKTVVFAEMEMSIFKNPFVGVDTALEATLVLIIAGLIAGYIPARRASRVKPIEALREE